jgi:hypothetical protein
MFDTVVDILLFNLYGAVVTVIALIAAIPYGAWQGLRWLRQRLGGQDHGDSGAGR